MATSISMTGADSAHLHKVTAETSRVLAFADGISRLILLTDWQWEVFDRWTEVTGSPQRELMDQALFMAREVRDNDGSETFEWDIRKGLELILDGMKSCFMSPPHYIMDVSNENPPDPQ